MRCSTLIRLLVLFLLAFLISLVVGFTIPQQPLSQSSNGPATKLHVLQTSLAARMSEHEKVMATELRALNRACKELALIVDGYFLHLHFLKTQLDSYPMRALLKDLGESLDSAEDYVEVETQKNLEIIKQSLALMTNELDDIEAFMLDIEERVNILSDEILQGRAKEDKTSVNGRKVEVHLVTAVITNNPSNDEQKVILAAFSDYVNTSTILAKLNPYKISMASNTSSHARFNTIFNSTIVNATGIFDNSCNSTVLVYFNPNNTVTNFPY